MTILPPSSLRHWRFSTFAAAAFTLVFLVASAVFARYIDWNAIRLTPTCALVHGLPIYSPPDHGIITGDIYPPLAALGYFPVAWLGKVSSMVTGASLLAIFYFILTPLLLARHSVRTWGIMPPDAIGVVVAALLLSVFDPGLRYAAVMVHAEAPGLACIGLAWLLAGTATSAGGAAWLEIGALATSALLGKQTFLPGWIVLAVWSGWKFGRRGLGRFLLGALGVTALVAAILALTGTGAAFLYNCLWLPSHHPLSTPGYGFFWGVPPLHQDWIARLQAVGLCFLPLMAGWWPGFALAGWSITRSRAKTEPVVQTAVLGGWMALAHLPLALFACAKVGGGANNFSPPLYFVVLTAMALGLHLFSREHISRHPLFRSVLACVLALLVICNLPRLGYLLYATAVRPETHEPMVAYLRKHPGEVYLPWNPLDTWIAEHRRDHFDNGVFDRALAGQPISAEHFRAGLPAHLRWVATHKGMPAATEDAFPHYLPDLRKIPSPAGLEDWTFFAVGPEGSHSSRLKP